MSLSGVELSLTFRSSPLFGNIHPKVLLADVATRSLSSNSMVATTLTSLTENVEILNWRVWRRERDLNPRGPKGPQANGSMIPGLGYVNLPLTRLGNPGSLRLKTPSQI